MSETLIDTFTTRAGSLVEALNITPDRVKSMDDMADQSGAIWRCHGCGDKSDRQLNGPAFRDPDAMAATAARSHATFCRS